MGLLFRAVLIFSLVTWCWKEVHSQPMLGPGDCHTNFTLDKSDVILNAPPGTVCIQCVFGSVVAMNAAFQIDNTNIDSSKGRVVNGVLVVFDTASVFNTVNAIDIQCSSDGDTHAGAVYLLIFLPPIITGGIIVHERDKLDLDCDTHNSRPRPSAQWFNPAGQLVGTERKFTVTVILRNQTGVYTCVAIQLATGHSMNSTVDVTVQFAPDVTADQVGLVAVPLGGTLELSCSILGVPPPNSISWTHNSTELLDMPPDVNIESTDTSTTLTVSDVKENEGGVYQCTAGNVVNENSATTNVRIQYVIVEEKVQLPCPNQTVVYECQILVGSTTLTWILPTMTSLELSGFEMTGKSRTSSDGQFIAFLDRSDQIPGSDLFLMTSTLQVKPPLHLLTGSTLTCTGGTLENPVEEMIIIPDIALDCKDESGSDAPSAGDGPSTDDGRSTGAIAGITFILVALPVGVLIGLGVAD